MPSNPVYVNDGTLSQSIPRITAAKNPNARKVAILLSSLVSDIYARPLTYLRFPWSFLK